MCCADDMLGKLKGHIQFFNFFFHFSIQFLWLTTMCINPPTPHPLHNTGKQNGIWKPRYVNGKNRRKREIREFGEKRYHSTKLNWLEIEWREENRSREDEERTFGYIEIWEFGCQGMGWGSPVDVGCKGIEGTYLLLAWLVKRVTAVLFLVI